MFVKKKIAAAAAVALCITAFAALGFAEEAKLPEEQKVVSVGEQTFSDREMLQLLQNSSGGNIMMLGLMLAQSTLNDRIAMAEQISDTLLFAEGARLNGLTERDNIAFLLKWQRIQLLAEAYIEERVKHWDLSDLAAKKYYDSHKDEFVQAESARVRHIVASTEKDAMEAILDIYRDKDFAKTAEKFSIDARSAAEGGNLGWVEKGLVPEPLGSEIEKAKLNSLSAPVKTDLGWHVFEVLERRPAKQLTFDEARQEIVQRMQMQYIEEELNALKKNLSVEINKEALENLGGIPAASQAPEQNDNSDAPLTE